MDQKVYKRIAKSEKNHWWFFSRKEIFTRLIKSLKIKRNSKIIEIHNRPKYVKTIKKYTRTESDAIRH